MGTSMTQNRLKVLEFIVLLRDNSSLSLRNKITKNINGIKEDIVLLKEVLEKLIYICQVYDTRQCLGSDLSI